jgi:hypothetical protein
MAQSARKRKASSERLSRKKKIGDLLTNIEKGFEAETPKATLADFIRLTQLERELEEEEQPEEIVITWVESGEQRDTGR